MSAKSPLMVGQLPPACEIPAAIWVLACQVAPPSVLKDPNSTASSLATLFVDPDPGTPPSFRESYQVAPRKPVLWSSAIRGRNWLLVVASSFTRTAALHVTPLSSEWRASLSPLLLSSVISSG